MLATQLNDLIHENKLPEYTIIEVSKYATSVINNHGKEKYVTISLTITLFRRTDCLMLLKLLFFRRVMVVLGINIKRSGEEVGEKIGNPQQLEGDDAAAAQGNSAQNNVHSNGKELKV